MARRPVAWVAAAVLVLEALGAGLLNWFLGLVVDRQSMSLAGLDPHAMSVGAWVAGGVVALYLLCCAFVLARTAVRDRAPGTVGRVLVISAAVVHGVLGAFCVGLVGWAAFFFMMLVLALLVLTLVAHERDGAAARPAASPEPSGPSDPPGAPAA